MRLPLTLLLLINSCCLNTLFGQTYYLNNQHSYGGDENDNAYAVVETADKGYIIVGGTNSNANGDVPDSKAFVGSGGSDFLVMKISKTGKLEWSKTFGGSKDDVATDIAKTSNGEYVIVGTTRSVDGDANYNGTNGGVLLIRLKEDGSFVSKRILAGGFRFNQAIYNYTDGYSKTNVKVAPNGQIFVGGTHEIGSSPYKGKQFFLTKLTPTGDTLWEKYYGGSNDEQMSGMTIAANGDIIMVGSTTSTGNEVSGAGKGGWDFMAARVDANGNLKWQKGWGGSGIDVFQGVTENLNQTGFVAVGETTSENGIASTSLGQKDAFILSFDNDGNMLWKKQTGGDGNDNLYGILKDGPNNYIAFGTSDSRIPNVQAKGALTDVLTVNISAAGAVNKLGQFGGEDIDVARGGIINSDGDWTLACISRSESEDLTYNHGENDFWLMTLTDPAPLEFSYFRGNINENFEGVLDFKTSYQSGAKSIIVEKSYDGQDFSKLTELIALENAPSGLRYGYTDKFLRIGPNYYRLKIVGLDGRILNGPMINLTYTPLASDPLVRDLNIRPYPNPTEDYLWLPLKNERAELSIISADGKSQFSENTYSDADGWYVKLQRLPAGIHFLRVKLDETYYTHRFVVR